MVFSAISRMGGRIRERLPRVNADSRSEWSFYEVDSCLCGSAAPGMVVLSLGGCARATESGAVLDVTLVGACENNQVERVGIRRTSPARLRNVHLDIRGGPHVARLGFRVVDDAGLS